MGPRARAAAVLLSVFALGLLAGMALERRQSAARPARMSVAEEHEASMSELREVLELDEHQVEQIHAILAERQQMVQRTWERLRPEVQAAMRQMHRDIAELLRPDQRERFHDWLMQRQEQSRDRYPEIPPER